MVGLGLAFFPQRNDPDRCDGAFYLSLSHIKTYRRRDEPEIVYLSDASVTNNAELNLDAAAPATLFANYTTPKAVITRKPEGSEGATTGIQSVDIVRGTDVLGYTTKVIVIGKTGDGAAVAGEKREEIDDVDDVDERSSSDGDSLPGPEQFQRSAKAQRSWFGFSPASRARA